MTKYITLYIIVMFAFCACQQKIKRDEGKPYSIFNENLITANKYLVKEDAERIANYIKRRSWQMEDGEGGIKYMICEKGNGDSVSNNPSISMDYKVELLDGTECYDSKTDGEKLITIGSGDLETGLNRAFKTFRHGDSAVLILPPHYAKGLIGDMNKIPPHSVIVYFVRIN